MRHQIQQPVCLSFLIIASLLLAGCGGGEGGPSGAEAPAGAAASLAVSLAWDPVSDPSVTGYVIHYGRTSPNSSGSCNYESSVFVSSTEGTVTSLSPDTRYYFTVSAYNGFEGPCSAEISTVMPPVKM